MRAIVLAVLAAFTMTIGTANAFGDRFYQDQPEMECVTVCDDRQEQQQQPRRHENRGYIDANGIWYHPDTMDEDDIANYCAEQANRNDQGHSKWTVIADYNKQRHLCAVVARKWVVFPLAY